MKQRVLIVEDDTRLAQMLAMHLVKLGCEVDHAEDGTIGLDMALGQRYDLIVLDRTLPGIEGLEVCRKVRASDETVRVLMLTALAEELDLVVGLEVGADDYVAKPFKVGELMARVQALLRRANQESTESGNYSSQRRYGAIQIDLGKRKVTVRGENVELTPREFDLLVYLASAPERVFTREDILTEVWGSDVLGYDHSISTIVKRLRRKIERDSSKPQHIRTVRGVGYSFCGEPH